MGPFHRALTGSPAGHLLLTVREEEAHYSVWNTCGAVGETSGLSKWHPHLLGHLHSREVQSPDYGGSVPWRGP